MKRAAAVVSLLLAVLPVFAQSPVRTENLVYTILAYNGRDFSPTFARAASGTIYLIAGAESFLTLRNTLVYFWPLTNEWKTNLEALDVPFGGTLEVTDRRGRAVSVTPSLYTYFNERGEYDLNWKVAQGAEAERIWNRWARIGGAYEEAMRAYRDRVAKNEAERSSLITRIQSLRDAGKDATILIDRMSSLLDPGEPQAPQDYVVPPVDLQQAFIVNLPRGQYTVRLRTPDGSILEGSEKSLVVHEKRRSGGVGYEVIPGDRWTRPVESTTPSAVLYVDGSSDLYLRPYFEDEYNDLFYAKTVRNDDRGNPNLMKWQRIQQVPRAALQLAGASAGATQVREEPWFVEQVQGVTLGYKIVPYDPLGAHKGQEPSLRAFRIPVSRGSSAIEVRALDKSGNPLPGSARQVRVVIPPRSEILLPLLALIPLLAMALVLFGRARRYRRS
jgi:hypothetical protein